MVEGVDQSAVADAGEVPIRREALEVPERSVERWPLV